MAFLDFFKSVDINNEVNRCRTTKGSVLLDVRTEEEYRSGHINLPHDKSAPLFVYCQSGARSRKAVSKLRKMGYTEVHNIGGIDSFQGQLQRGKR